MKKYYRVKTGFGADDFVSIDETEVERAIIAQGSGKVAVFKNGTVTGNHIISVKPDIHKLLGYNPLYQLKAEDLNEVPRKALTEHEEYLAIVGSKITGQPIPTSLNSGGAHTQGMKSIGEIMK